MRRFPKFRDDRFALTTLQNPLIEVRTYAELVQAAQHVVAQPLLAVQAAAPVAAAQPLAVPDAPDSIPTTEIHVNDAFTPPDPDSTALAPLDSANADSTDDDAQQILDSLVASVLSASSSLPSLSSDEDELTAPPTPKPRRKAKTKSRRKSKHHPFPVIARAQASLAARDNNAASAAQDDQPGKIKSPTKTTLPTSPQPSATPANVPSATILNANLSKKHSCNGAAPRRS